MIEHSNITIQDAAFVAAANGILLTVTTSAFEGPDNDEEDFPAAFAVANQYIPNIHLDSIWLNPRLTSTAGTSSLIFGETLIGNAEDCTININVNIKN